MNFLEYYPLLLTVFFIASFVQGFSGFGFALISIPLLTIFIDIKEIVPLGALCGLITNIYLLIKLKQHIELKSIMSLVVPSIAGIPLGTVFLNFVESEILKMLLGFVVLVFVFINLISFRKKISISSFWSYPAGFFSGFFGGALNTNGPPVIIYLTLRNYNKDDFRATISGFFLLNTLMIIFSHVIIGITTTSTLISFFPIVPILIIGIFLGNSLNKKINIDIFKKVVLLLLLVISFSLIFF